MTTRQVILQPEPEGGYTVTVPSLPGCISYGETIEEAFAMIKEAIELMIEDMIAHGEEVPPATSVLLGTVEVNEATHAPTA